MKVELSKLFLTPEELYDQARNSDADVIGISSHAAGHLTLVPKFMDLVKNNEEFFSNLWRSYTKRRLLFYIKKKEYLKFLDQEQIY